MKVYISGKITGQDPVQTAEKFRQAGRQVAAFGHEPVSPLDNGLSPDAPWREHIARDIAMLLECDGIYLLRDWSESPGARIELNIAQECGFEIMEQPEYAM